MEVGSLLPLRGSQGLDSGLQLWLLSPLAGSQVSVLPGLIICHCLSLTTPKF